MKGDLSNARSGLRRWLLTGLDGVGPCVAGARMLSLEPGRGSGRGSDRKVRGKTRIRIRD